MYARVNYSGTGIAGPYTVPFPYISRTHVFVYLNDVLTTEYTWLTASTIRFNSVVAGGTVIKIQRQSSLQARLVDHQDASTLTEATLDQDGLQAQYLAQEQEDEREILEGLIGEDGTGINPNLPVTFNDIVVFNGAVSFGPGGSIDLPPGSVMIDDLNQEVIDLINNGGASGVTSVMTIACSDETSDLTTTDNPRVTFKSPFTFTLSELPVFTLTTASSSGVVTLNVKKNGVSILSTLVTIDATEDTSKTAAVAAVVSDAVINEDDEITAEITTAGTGATGLKMTLEGVREGVTLGGGTDTSGSVPAGVVLPFAGTSAPTGFLMLTGQTVSRTTYADLFAAISTTYGVGDGVTTFKLPDPRGRAFIGAGSGSGLTVRTLGATGGAETHALTAAESGSPAHTHTGSTSATTSGISVETWVQDNDGTLGPKVFGGIYDAANQTGTVDASGTHSHTVTIDANSAAAASSAHNNMQPWLCLNYIIKT